MYGIIYKITNLVNNKVYIGQTVHTVKERYNGSIAYTKNIPLRNAIKKYGIENFKVTEPLSTAETKEELDEKEQIFIALYDSNNKEHGYNVLSGGHNGKHSPESRKKIGDAQRGELNHMYGKRGKDNPRYCRIKTVCAYCGKEIEVTKSRFKRNKYNYCCPEHKKASRLHLNPMESHRISVVCEICGKEYETYPSLYADSEHHYCSRECMHAAFRTRYAGENNPNYGQHKVAGSNNGRAKKVLCVTTGEVFGCAVDASKKYNLTKGLVTACCRGDQKTAGGMVWKFI